MLDVRFQAPGNGVTVIFGPSGCGKTSLLRTIAGLEHASEGLVRVNRETWQEKRMWLPVHQRRLGYVFQQPGLFPHLSVRDNLLFGARYQAGGIGADQVVAMLELGSLMMRPVATLSGGEQQRVALGRALLANPRLLLLDEPLSALDIGARGRLIPFLESALHALEIPALYVTHSADELVRLADHLIVMEAGQVVTAGPMAEVLAAMDTPLAVMDDAFSALTGHLAEPAAPGLSMVVSTAGHCLQVPGNLSSAGRPVRLRIQARDVSLCLSKPENTSILNILPAIVEEVSKVSASGQCTVRLDLGGERLLARISDYSRQQLQIVPGLAVFAQVKAVAVIH